MRITVPASIATTQDATIEKLVKEATENRKTFHVDAAVAHACYGLKTVNDIGSEMDGPTFEGFLYEVQYLTRLDGQRIYFWTEYGDEQGGYKYADLLPEDDEETLTGWTYAQSYANNEPDIGGDMVKPDDYEAVIRKMVTTIVEWANDTAIPLNVQAFGVCDSGSEIAVNGDTLAGVVDDMIDYLNQVDGSNENFRVTRILETGQDLDSLEEYNPLTGDLIVIITGTVTDVDGEDIDETVQIEAYLAD